MLKDISDLVFGRSICAIIFQFFSETRHPKGTLGFIAVTFFIIIGKCSFLRSNTINLKHLQDIAPHIPILLLPLY